MLIQTVLLFFSFSFYPQDSESKMSPTEIADFKQMVQKQAKTITSIQTDFTQKKQMAFLENSIVSKGSMFLNQDGHLKWQYVEPNKYSIIFKNEKIYINDNGNKSTPQVDQKLFKKISSLIASSIQGNIFNDAEFNYAYFKKGSNNLVRMTSKDKTLAKYIKEIELTFPKNDALVSQVKLIEPSDDFTLIIFNNRKLNATIDKKEFDH